MSDPTNQSEARNGDEGAPAQSLRAVLGIRAGADHFELLGLDSRECTPERVVSALQDQLTRLNDHADADTPEADQLRMTLHAAAADAIRDILSARTTSSENAALDGEVDLGVAPALEGPQPVARPQAAVARPAARAQVASVTPSASMRPELASPGSPAALAAMAHLILGMHGGWNDASRRHLMLLARTHGASPDQLVQTIQALTRRGAPQPQRAVAAPAPIPTPTQAARPNAPVAPVPTGPAPAAPVPMQVRPAPAMSGAMNAAVAPKPNGSASTQSAANGATQARPPSPRATAPQPKISEAEAIAKVRAIGTAEPDPTRRLLLIGAAIVVVVILVLIGLLVGAIAIANASKARNGTVVPPPPVPAATQPASSSSPPSVPASPTRDPSQPAPVQAPKPLFDTSKPAVEASKPAPTSVPVALRRWDDVLRDLRMLGDTASADTGATAAQFEKLFAEMASAWVETTPDGHAAAADGVVELLFRLGGDREAVQRVFTSIESATALSAPATLQQVRSRAFAGGVIARIARERDLPSVARGRVDELAPKVLGSSWSGGGATFRMGAVGALSQATGAMMPPVVDLDNAGRAVLIDAWREWVRDMDAAEQERTPEGTRRILQALEDVMLAGPDPAANRSEYEVIGLLGTLLTWRDSDASRDRLIRWFDAPGVTASDLHALTSALANSSAASNIDLSMVLSPSADAGQRAVMRDRYAAVWSLSVAGARTAQVQDWLARARGALAISPDSPPARLANGAYMANLNAAAAYVWAGEVFPIPLQGGPMAVAAPPPGASAPPGSVLTLTTPGVATSPAQAQSSWGVQYLAAGPNIPARRELLQRVVGPLSKLDAAVLASEAMRGSPQQLRQDAMGVARRFLGDVAMIEALLELSPQIPATLDNTEFLEAAVSVPLPGPRHPTWRLEVRRALVARMLEMLGGSAFKEVDALSDQFASAYAATVEQLNPPGSSGAAGVVRDTPAPSVSALAIRVMWQRRAEATLPSGREPMTLAQINAARPARLRLARTPIHQVSVEQANIAELMAFVVVAEHPDTAADASSILADLAQQRAAANHIFDQLEAGERAILRLWMLRFGETTVVEVPPMEMPAP